ncbi:replication stress response regulator SDE2 [Harmonia axyridis]|uniref:replication stress response regulator SDE2 n=1 Tax=Harmonia axyridis TaxID=115357 RepID=UPI001E275562|nr:replication stress response regulator SDE2 [Harmonia axyridis]
MDVVYNNDVLFHLGECSTVTHIYERVIQSLKISKNDLYLEQNGKKLDINGTIDNNKNVKVILRLNGGKGGFGSMLRAIGAQIEKTTNREACRDLSGRRLRDINEEQRLKNWLATQADREKETADRKRKKLERMCEEPKHEFKDDAYFKEISELPKRVEDAVLQGLEASSSMKRPSENDTTKKTKKRKLWLDADLEGLTSSDEDSDSEKSEKEVVVAVKDDAVEIQTESEETSVENLTEEKQLKSTVISV